MPKVLSLISLEGGSGKTTTALNLAYLAWQKFHKKTVIIDLDNNQSLYAFLGIEKDKPQITTSSIFAPGFKGDWQLESIFESQGEVKVLLGSADLNPEIIATQKRRENILAKVLRQYPINCDLIICDNRGGIDSIVDNSLVAASDLLVLSRVGVKTLTIGESVARIDANINDLDLDPPPKLLGVLFNEAKKKNTHQQTLEGAKTALNNLGVKLYPPIPHSNWIDTANIWLLPIAALRPGERPNKIYAEILEDLF